MKTPDTALHPIPATAAVLAGGGSRRMGRDKALLPWKGVPLGVHVAHTLSAWFEETIVVADPAGAFEGSPFRVVDDVFPGKGTLGGIHGALAASGRQWTFLASCDMPFIAETLVRLLWSLREGRDAVVPVRDGRMEVTCALYASSCLEPASRALENGRRRAVSFLDEVRVLSVAEDRWSRADPRGKSFMNLNTLEEYERALRSAE